MLCQFSDIFGKPRTGIHSLRIFDFALIDVLLTVGLGYLIGKFSGRDPIIIIICLFVLGTLLHILFCVDTKFVSVMKSYINVIRQ